MLFSGLGFLAVHDYIAFKRAFGGSEISYQYKSKLINKFLSPFQSSPIKKSLKNPTMRTFVFGFSALKAQQPKIIAPPKKPY